MSSKLKEIILKQIQAKKEELLNPEDISKKVSLYEKLLSITFENITHIDYTSIMNELGYEGFINDIEFLDIIKITIDGINEGFDLEITEDQKETFNNLLNKLRTLKQELESQINNIESQNHNTNDEIKRYNDLISSMEALTLVPEQVDLIHEIFESEKEEYSERYIMLLESLKRQVNKHNKEDLEAKKSIIIDILKEKGIETAYFTDDMLEDLVNNSSAGKIREILGVLEENISDGSYKSKTSFLVNIFKYSSSSHIANFLVLISDEQTEYEYLYKHPRLLDTPSDNESEEDNLLLKVQKIKAQGLSIGELLKKCPTALYSTYTLRNASVLDLYGIKPTIGSVYNYASLADTIDSSIEQDIFDLALENQTYLSRSPYDSIFYALYEARKENKKLKRTTGEIIPLKERKEKRYEVSRRIVDRKNNFSSENKLELTGTLDPTELVEREYPEYKRELRVKKSDLLEIPEEILTHPFIIRLDAEKEDEYSYTINGDKETGIIISRYKVLRVFNGLLKNGVDPKIALECAMLKGSILSSEEIGEIKEFAKYITNERNFSL